MRPSYSLLLSPLLLAACATPANHYDPAESVNRKIYAFNRVIDKAVLKPVAKGYETVTPPPIRKGVSNFFANLEDVYIGVSNLLQGKVKDAASDTGRVLANSTFGLLGLVDVATPMGLQKHDEDFGQVLGAWGVSSGPYLVLPFMGPKTLRDTADTVGSYYLDPLNAIQDQGAENALRILKLVDTRTKLFAAESLIESASFGDEYAFVRDSYLQRRYNLVWDGAPPKPLPLGDESDDFDPAAPDPAPASGEPASKPAPTSEAPAAPTPASGATSQAETAAPLATLAAVEVKPEADPQPQAGQ
ncbi:VacJ family lipoprotein [Chitinimonas sp.]|uniref:MlaA family lipoprotein n=1 Tax=Chitinimonas sp. TaxID=1934313 RepID=UPI002F947A8B